MTSPNHVPPQRDKPFIHHLAPAGLENFIGVVSLLDFLVRGQGIYSYGLRRGGWIEVCSLNGKDTKQSGAVVNTSQETQTQISEQHIDINIPNFEHASK